MKLIFQKENFDKDFIEKLAKAINESNPEEVIEMYLHSNGGSTAIKEAVTDIINANPEKFTLVGYEYLASSAFNLFIKAKCRKKLLPGTIGMYHLATNTLDFNDRMKPVYGIDEACIKRIKEFDHPSNLEFMKACGFTAKETRQAIKGNDVFFQYERFLEIVNHYQENQSRC